MSPSLLLTNLQSLRPKLDELSAVVAVLKPNIIAVCESWLSENVTDDEVRLQGYSTYRCDRSNGKKGGGVCVYVNYSLHCEEWVNNGFHRMCPFIECVALIMKQVEILLIVIYVPPGMSSSQHQDIIEYLIEVIDHITTSLPDIKTIIAGDMNQLPTSHLEQQLNMKQLVDLPTRGNAILDKILFDRRLLTSEPNQGSTSDNEEKRGEKPICTIHPEIDKSDHRVVFLNSVNLTLPKPQLRKVFDYRASHLNAFKTYLRSYPWTNFYRADMSADNKCNLLHMIIEDAVSVLPCSYVEFSAREKPWMTPLIKSLINRRYAAFREKNYILFQHYKSKVKEAIHKAKQTWTRKESKSLKGLWTMVKGMRNRDKESSLHGLLQTFDSPVEAANAINERLGEFFSKQPNWQEQKSHLPKDGPSWLPIVESHKVYNILAHLKTNKAAGSDNLTPRLLKEAAQELSEPLTHVLSLVFQSSTVPNKWKIAKVVPIPKKRNPKIDDLRPLSMLPLFSKIMEKVVLESTKKLLIAMYGDSQFGFRPGYSTTHAHVRIHDFITKSLNSKEVKAVAMVSFDMKKAFDSLNHKHLMRSLRDANLPPHFLKWCASYLQNRFQYVSINQSTHSKLLAVTSGIPQGSVIAPFLFAGHMGSLQPKCAATCITKYADDVVSLIPISEPDKVRSQVKEEIDNVDSWCTSNGLQLNVSKTKILLITNSKSKTTSVSLTQLTQLKILGLTYTNDLRWDVHVSNVIKKASQQIYILKKLRTLLPSNELVKIYNAVILSVIEYCAPVMVGMSKRNSDRIERIRRRCHRVVCGNECQCNAFETISVRRLKQAIKFFQSMTLSHNLLNPLIPSKLPRTHHYMIHFISTTSRMRSFIPFITLHYNKHNL
jgi:hypothetical protein